MANILPINKTKAMMLGKLAGLSAALAMILVTPLISLANPAMCGRTPLSGTWTEVQVIQGFTLKTDGTIATFTPAKTQTIELGSLVEVAGPDPKDGSHTIDVPVVVAKLTFEKKSGKYTAISVNDALHSSDAWQVNFLVDVKQVTNCTLVSGSCSIPKLTPTTPSVPLVKPIIDSINLTPAPVTVPIMLGSLVAVQTDSGPQAAAFVAAVTPTTGGGAYGRALVLATHEVVKVVITQAAINQIKAHGGTVSGTGW